MKIEKTAKEIKDQILRRFDKVSGYSTNDFKNISKTLHFEDFSESIQKTVLNKFELNKFELPVLLSFIDNNCFLLLSTEHFFYFENNKKENIKLTEFSWGVPDEDTNENEECYEDNFKIEGRLMRFFLIRKDDSKIKILINTGAGIVCLWNTFRTIELIGRKYEIVDYK